MPDIGDYKMRSCKAVILNESDPLMQEILANNTPGERVIVQDSDHLDDGHYEVEEVLNRTGNELEAHLYPLVVFD